MRDYGEVQTARCLGRLARLCPAYLSKSEPLNQCINLFATLTAGFFPKKYRKTRPLNIPMKFVSISTYMYIT